MDNKRYSVDSGKTGKRQQKLSTYQHHIILILFFFSKKIKKRNNRYDVENRDKENKSEMSQVFQKSEYSNFPPVSQMSYKHEQQAAMSCGYTCVAHPEIT